MLTVAGPLAAGLLYFVLPDGRLAPVPILLDGPAYGPGAMITLLMNGPDTAAKTAGLHTELPSSNAPVTPDGRALTQMTGEGSVRVRLPSRCGPCPRRPAAR
ncbi:hypothetical protein OS965_11885 [Streptomyces sp. H27-G5]|uniref:hypothetical protein n=1 Tax=Streptomyces sp. H27-G5 TaxID=2996698 RepID=UPI00227052FB|nr:hypothetical protein [Streptomyces sp. H27-G5]MCY0918873.1 hypothetical protein [Streptomyces sp. H27-G5]